MIIAIDTLSHTPIYEQLRNQVVLGIAAGRLAEGEGLPSVRRLAADLGINFHTVNKGYAMLQDEGYIVMDRRKGAVVAERAAQGEAFREGLAMKMRLASAEAVCRGMDRDDFVALCAESFRMVREGCLGGAV